MSGTCIQDIPKKKAGTYQETLGNPKPSLDIIPKVDLQVWNGEDAGLSELIKRIMVESTI